MAHHSYKPGIGETVSPMPAVGDTFTLAGDHPKVSNPARRWWTPWRPRLIVDTTRLAVFTVVAKFP